MEPWTHNLPSLLSSFVGRAHELDEVRRLLVSHRLLTLTGPGGCGKTRLAIRVAQSFSGDFNGCVWLVELAPLFDPSLVPRAVAATLGVYEMPGVPLSTTLAGRLAQQQTLLVLDNCEHLVSACATLVEALLCTCPRLRILATSREALSVAGELVWAVPPLSFPATPPIPSVSMPPCDLLRCEAVVLFIERAKAANPKINIDVQALQIIGEICRRLDGIPLAIELAAARVRVLSVQQIAARLEDCFQLLTAGSRTAPTRQQTLEATLDWSYCLLSAKERAVFRRLSVLAGWSLEAAEAICADNDIAPCEVFELLSNLINKSLVVMSIRSGEAHYDMLEVVRQYAYKQLICAGELARVQDRHLLFFARLTEQAKPQLIGADQVAWFERLEMNLDNLRAAMSRSIERATINPHSDEVIRALRMPADLERFWAPRGYSSEGAERLRHALDLPSAREPAAALARAHALNAASVLAWLQGQYDEARLQVEEALAIGRATEDQMTILVSLRNLGTVAVLQRDASIGIPLLEHSLALGREMGVEGRHSLAWTLAVLGSAAYLQGEDARASALFEESIALLRVLGDANFLSLSLRRLGQIALRHEHHERAYALLRESLELNNTIGSPSGIASSMVGLAGVLLAQRRPTDASRLLGAAKALLDETADQLSAVDRDLFDDLLRRARAWLGPEAFRTAWEQGRILRSTEAVAYVVASIDRCTSEQPRATSASARPFLRPDVDTLTARELEVATLVTQGRSNREIARELVVEIKTVEAHISRILSKLAANSRVQIATWAIECGLVPPQWTDK